MIYLSPRAGLCNRLRVINSCLRLVKEHEEGLVVHWERMADMNAFFSELFEVTNAFRLVERSFSRFSFERILFSEINPHFISHHNGERFVKLVSDSRRPRNIYFESFYDVYHNDDYSWLKPVPRIQSAIDNARHLACGRVGIHVRRTDHKKCIENSPLRLFVDKMREEITKYPATTFFLSTDDERVKEQLRNEFPNKVYTRENVAARRDENGVADAVIDLFLLSTTRCIYGSYPSSFSSVAAQIGRVGLEYLTIENPWGDGPRG